MDKVRHLLESPQLRRFDSRSSFDTGHKDAVNDAKLDYYSRKLATASSDKSVRIYSVDSVSGAYIRLAELTGYEGPVWQVAWSHPALGSMLATASYDGRVIIWKEVENDGNCPMKSRWYALFDEQINKISVNSVSWASEEYGAILAAGSLDGSISVLSLSEDGDRWRIKRILKAHELGCQCISWSRNSKRFVSGGNDNSVKIWSFQNGKQWEPESTLQGHSDWVCSVDWSPSSESLIMSAGRDGRVLMWSRIEEPEKPKWNHSSSFSNSNLNLSHSVISVQSGEEWTPQVLKVFDQCNTLQVCWDPMGIFLCVVGNNDQVYIWKKNFDGGWECVANPDIANAKDSNSSNHVKSD